MSKETLSPEMLALLVERAKKKRAAEAAARAESGAAPLVAAHTIPRRPGAALGRPVMPTHAQQRLWLLEQIDPGNTAYNISALLRLSGALDFAALAGALTEVVRRHGRNVSALLALAGQRDPRIRLGMPALATFADGLRASFVLENLALGGVAVSGVPHEWEPEMAVAFALGHSRDPNILEVQGTISWREGDTVGIALDPETSGDGTEVQNALGRFLEKRRE